ncbi:MAG: GH3 auxin-responsive promoter family protein [Acidobacteria bacterium]|nr:GH3 auxin-responsive promoter family protein [Acidobacteriota bacterium]MCB9397073.1 GH3 auxin-responsive promoter family protein [Acidobacteriota bacterium]
MLHKLVRVWARNRAKSRPHPSPETVLRQLLQRAKDTPFGKEFGFADILRSQTLIPSFQARVPLFDYSRYLEWLGDWDPESETGTEPLVNRSWPGSIQWFCLSSGTSSGRTKYIPYSKEMAEQNRRAAYDLTAQLALCFPQFNPLRHKTLYMSGSTRLQPNQHGVVAGDMSGLTKWLAPKLLENIVLPPQSISELEPWSVRLEALVQLCQKRQDIGILSGIPIWQLTFLETLQGKSGQSIRELLPNLRFLIHGGMSIAPYRQKISEILGSGVQLVEVYAASELGIAAFQLPGEAGMRFFEHYGVFYEFEDGLGNMVPRSDLEPGVAYNVLISSCAGLWRYRIGDQVVFKSINPMVLERVGRDKTTSAFDEKVTEFEVEFAMQLHPELGDFAMGPDLAGRRHVWFVVGEPLPQNFDIQKVDDRLRLKNLDYDDYRGDGRINPPISFHCPDRAAFLNALKRIEGGQRKFPRLLTPEETLKLLATFGPS